jgi:hypothetical protein
MDLNTNSNAEAHVRQPWRVARPQLGFEEPKNLVADAAKTSFA